MAKRTGDVLFVHNNFPGQFGFIARALQARGHRCAAIGSHTAKGVQGVELRQWRLGRGTTEGIFPLAIRAEADLLRARAAAACALSLREAGFDPDLIIGHPGWGETLLLAEIFPRARTVLHGEFYYGAEGGDVGFDPEFGALTTELRFRVRAKNLGLATAFVEADAIVCPTPYQAARFPHQLRDRISIIHEGVDTDAIRPDPTQRLTLADGRVLDRATPVVTFVNRRFEPLRGYHVFMRALPRLMAEVPDVQVLMIGAADGSGYGHAPPEGRTWKDVYLDELGDRIDRGRLHFTGPLPLDKLHAAMRIGRAHIYLTYPFVLSWSLLEAMACGCMIIGSDTEPVRDAIVDGETGRLVDFFDIEGLADRMIAACRHPAEFEPLREAARRSVVERFDRARICEPAWLSLVDRFLI